jgi:hypothetical protein
VDDNIEVSNKELKNLKTFWLFSIITPPPDLSQAGPCGASGLFTIPEDRGQTGSVVKQISSLYIGVLFQYGRSLVKYFSMGDRWLNIFTYFSMGDR